jgi:ribonuclease M5
MEKIKVRQLVLVEGKYDVQRLSALLDGAILKTDGFSIYTRPAVRLFLQQAAAAQGLIVLTDSDAAGLQIRRYIQSFIPPAQLTHVYIPAVPGKEKRKHRPSKAGMLGVEGMTDAMLLTALQNAGVAGQDKQETESNMEQISAYDLYRDGFSGSPAAATRRNALLRQLGLPQGLRPPALRTFLNAAVGARRYRDTVSALQKEAATDGAN